MPSTLPNSARHALRTATAPDHARVDEAFSRFDLSSPQDYARFLQAQAAAVLPVEAAIDLVIDDAVIPDWPQRRRAHLLLQDLGDLGAEPPQTDQFPSFVALAETLGAIYVLEGSRLGGGLLARTVPSDLPRRFLGTSDPARWRALIEVLDRMLVSDCQREASIDAARRVFGCFEAGARVHARTG